MRTKNKEITIYDIAESLNLSSATVSRGLKDHPAIRKETKRKIIYIIKNENTRKEKVKYVVDAVQKNGGIDYTINKMNLYKKEAMEVLHQFPASDIRNGFEDLVNYVTDRKY